MDKIICLGKNYAEHATELKEELPEKPVLFIKPPSSLVTIEKQSTLALPFYRGDIHHELEVVFKLYKKNIIAVGIGLDLTLRDLQKQLKSKGHPWEISKTFKNSAVLFPLKSQRDFPQWQNESFSLWVNGELRQEAMITQALLKPDQIIHHVDQFFTLCDGDLIFTGTPKGVGSLKPNDQLTVKWGPIEKTIILEEIR